MKWTQERLDKFIYMKKAGFPLNAIAEELGCTYAAAQTKNKKLVSEGIVERQQHGGDRRAKTIVEPSVKTDTIMEDNAMDKPIIMASAKTVNDGNAVYDDNTPTVDATAPTVEAVSPTENADSQTENNRYLIEAINKGLSYIDKNGLDVTIFRVNLAKETQSQYPNDAEKVCFYIHGKDKDGYVVDIDVRL